MMQNSKCVECGYQLERANKTKTWRHVHSGMTLCVIWIGASATPEDSDEG